LKEKKMEDWNELKPEGNKQELYRKLSSSTQFKQYSSVLVVGYEPYLTDMISDIISDGKGMDILSLRRQDLQELGQPLLHLQTYMVN
jgi:phosphohistidine phosphatase SixA